MFLTLVELGFVFSCFVRVQLLDNVVELSDSALQVGVLDLESVCGVVDGHDEVVEGG